MRDQMIERPFKVQFGNCLLVVTRHGMSFATSAAGQVELEKLFQVETHAFDEQKFARVRKCVARMRVFHIDAKLLRKLLQLLRRRICGEPPLQQFRAERPENRRSGHRVELN